MAAPRIGIEEDQGGGIVWRYRDKDNYYIVRANALEDNVVLYKVQNGKREDLPLKEVPIRLYFRGRSDKDDEETGGEETPVKKPKPERTAPRRDA